MKNSSRDSRIKIGIILNYSKNWMGGIIYILNLIKTLNYLDDHEKPEILLFHSNDLQGYVHNINYPYLKKIKWNFPPVYKNYISSFIRRKNMLVNEILSQYEINGIYPVHDFPVKTNSETKIICWYADLQHKYYPQFFSRRKLIERDARIKFSLKNAKDLVVSSKTVAEDFEKFYPAHNGIKIHIFHFVSIIDGLDKLDIEEVKNKYSLPEKYFIISNQFHKHKNHKVVLQALNYLKKNHSNVHIAMTGKFPDASHSQYMQEIHSLIRNLNLDSNLSLLGVIPREEQLLLMKYAQAVIQPSLFEGWSTVIEDAKSLQVPVIASDIPVNREQLGESASYFNPFDHKRLASVLKNYPQRNMNDHFYEDYHMRVKSAAKNFLELFQ